MAATIGPIVESQLSPDQAAKRGGTCGPNIRTVVAHLGAPHRPSPPPGASWELIMGRFAPVVDQYITDALQGTPVVRSTAVLFADQSKAFERLSLQWLALLLRCWGLPPWVQHS